MLRIFFSIWMLLFITSKTFAQALDESFSEGGKFFHPTDNVLALGPATCEAIQPDGKIILGGNASNGEGNRFSLTRLNADGSIDASFGKNGQVVMDVPSPGVTSGAAVTSIAVAKDGKIVFTGAWQCG